MKMKETYKFVISFGESKAIRNLAWLVKVFMKNLGLTKNIIKYLLLLHPIVNLFFVCEINSFSSW